MFNSKLKPFEPCVFSKSKWERKNCSLSTYIDDWFHRNFPVGSTQIVFRASKSFLDFVALSKYKKLFVSYDIHIFTKLFFLLPSL